MKTVVSVLVGLLIIYLVFFHNQGNQEPTQTDIQSLESLRDEDGELVDVPLSEKDGVPYPQISHGFKKLGKGELPKPLSNLKELLPDGPAVLPIFRQVSDSMTKKRMYLPDYYRKDTMPMDNIGSEEMRPFVTDEEKPDDAWTDENVSKHPKFYNANIENDELTNIGSFFDKNNQYNDTTSPGTFPLPSDNCYINKTGGKFCLDNTRLQISPPSLITDPKSNYALNTVGMYKDYDRISDNTQRVINGGKFYGTVRGANDIGTNETFGTPIQDKIRSCQL
jgi:hypothetical protein